MDRPTSPLRAYRKAKGLSLESIGAPLGVNRSTVLRWEMDRIPAERLADVERVTGIPRQKLRPELFDAPAREGAQVQC